MKTPMHIRNHKGLTLVEVLVSVTFSAILLAGLSVPLSIGLINRQQGQNLTSATNLAQAQIESIRGSWMDPQASATTGVSVGQNNFDNNNIAIAWNAPNATSPCVSTAGGSLTNVYLATNLNLTYNDATNFLLSDPSQIPPNSTAIPSATRNIAIDANGDCQQDYWGQIIFGNAPDSTGTGEIPRTKRVVVRIFRVQTNPTSFSYIPVNAGRPTSYGTSTTTQNGVAISNLPVAVVVADIPRT
jgi:type II secretory pathway pseudopilin PulG